MTESSSPPTSSSQPSAEQPSSNGSSDAKPVLYRKDGTPDRRQDARDYTYEEKVAAMTRAAFVGPTQAAKDLGIPRDTLSSWCHRTFHDEYREIRERERARTVAHEEEMMLEEARARRELAAKAAGQLGTKINEGDIDARELSNIQRNLDTGAAIYYDKYLKSRDSGQANVNINVSADITEVLRSLGGEFAKVGASLPDDIRAAIDGEAEDVTEDG